MTITGFGNGGGSEPQDGGSVLKPIAAENGVVAAVHGKYLKIFSGDEGTLVDKIETPRHVADLELDGSTLYVSTDMGIQRYDISDPSNVTYTDSLSVEDM